MKFRSLVVFASLLVPLTAQKPAPATLQGIPQDQLKAYSWREIGPYRGGRSAAVAGVPQDRDQYYFGAAGGGVWKTTDAGISWDNVSDGYFGGSIGAVAVSEWDPNVVYVGGGEKTVRGNVSHGDGLWRSTDAGRTWTFLGLAESRHISRIRIHPRDPDHIYVAVMGHLFGDNEERGLYESRDGGTTFEKIHYVSDKAGCVDLIMDPTNPRILYATFWQIKRTPYSLESGGPDSGIFKSTDSGATWTDITRNEGLPEGVIGIAGITVSRSNPDNLYAIIEAEEGGVFRSRDAGETWRRVNEDRSMRQRAWYYSRIYADPQDEEGVYVLNVGFHHSTDGGRSFGTISVPHGDNHDLWIDPNDPLRMIESNDGGANVSEDGGETWTPQNTQPTAQFYRVSTDQSFPYRLLGGQQDNSAVRIRSRSLRGGSIGTDDWESTAGGESGHISAKPDDPDFVVGGSYGGYMQVVNHRTGETRAIDVWPEGPMGHGAEDLRYRFQWNYPLFWSMHDPEVLYSAANVLFRSVDRGQSWQPISPDLTRDDESRQGSSGGPITQDNTSVEYYCTIFAVAESPLDPAILWCGSDDGLIHVTRDGGRSWENVTPPSMPEWMQINCVDADPRRPGGLYVAGTRYKSDDFKPYLYKTDDYGKTWTEITAGIDPLHFTRAIRADPDTPGLLYAGTERGVYVSYDDGAQWQSLQLNLPIVPITDLAVRDGDLIAATQGRGFWALDNLQFLQQLDPSVAEAAFQAFSPRPVYRIGGGRGRGRPRNAGTNPASGVVLRYWIGEEPEEDTALELEILDGEGTVVREYQRRREGGGDGEGRGRRGGAGNTRLLPAEAGLNQFVWDFSYPGAESFPGMVVWNRSRSGPRAVPGTYRARFTFGETEQTVEFEILPDPRSSATQADMVAQRDFMLEVRDKLSEMHGEIRKIRETRDQIAALETRAEGVADTEDLLAEAEQLEEEMGEIEKALYQTKNRSSQDPLNFPIQLNDRLAGVLGLASRGDFGPTEGMLEMKSLLFDQINGHLQQLRELWETRLPALNEKARAAGVPLVAPGAKGDDEGGDRR